MAWCIPEWEYNALRISRADREARAEQDLVEERDKVAKMHHTSNTWRAFSAPSAPNTCTMALRSPTSVWPPSPVRLVRKTCPVFAQVHGLPWQCHAHALAGGAELRCWAGVHTKHTECPRSSSVPQYTSTHSVDDTLLPLPQQKISRRILFHSRAHRFVQACVHCLCLVRVCANPEGRCRAEGSHGAVGGPEFRRRPPTPIRTPSQAAKLAFLCVHSDTPNRENHSYIQKCGTTPRPCHDWQPHPGPHPRVPNTSDRPHQRGFRSASCRQHSVTK